MYQWDRSSAWLERLPVKEEVAGSNPVGPANRLLFQILPGMEEHFTMWKTLRKQFDSTDSIVSLVLGLAVVLVIGMTIVNYVKSKAQTSTTTDKTSQEAKGPVSLPAKHAVASGESLWTIAETYYKSGYNWTDIKDENKLVSPDLIEAGTVLTIPDVAPKNLPTGAISSAATGEKPKDATYTVVEGDDLWNIANKKYGDPYKWVNIAAANKLENPSVIHPGNVLMLP